MRGTERREKIVSMLWSWNNFDIRCLVESLLKPTLKPLLEPMDSKQPGRERGNNFIVTEEQRERGMVFVDYVNYMHVCSHVVT